MKYAETVLDLVGNTPLVKLNKVTDGIKATVLAKIEYVNPGGSSKDRIASRIIDAAEREGKLKPGGTIVEPTSGNTGIGLALVAQQRGYRCVFVLPDKVGEDKRNVLLAYGAEIVVTPTSVAPDSPDSYYSVSDRLVKEIPGAFKPDQYSNPQGTDQPLRDDRSRDLARHRGEVTHFVAGVGTGGTISGVGKYLKEQNAAIQVIGADPEGSVYSGGTGRPYLVEGVGEDFWPTAYDPTVVDEIIASSDAESFEMTRRLAREEGLLVGGSSGLAVSAALKAARDLPADAVVVVLLPDGGRGYLGKVFNDKWMRSLRLPARRGRQHRRRHRRGERRRSARPHPRAPERHRAPHDRQDAPLRHLADAGAVGRAARRDGRGGRLDRREEPRGRRVLGRAPSSPIALEKFIGPALG